MATTAAAAAAVSPGIGTFGRGRGRGRGLRASNGHQQSGTTTPGQRTSANSSVLETRKAPSSDKSTRSTSSPSIVANGTSATTATTIIEKTHCDEVTKIMKKLSGLTEPEVMKDILPEIEALKSQQIVEDLVSALSEKALLDAKFAVIAAKIAHKLWDNESMHSFVRNPLLKQTQEFYNKRELLLKENKYHGLCVYLSQLFRLLRIREHHLQPVGNAVVDLLKGLIEKSDGPSDEDVFYFYQELECVGGIIGENFPEKLDEVINLARQMVISSSLLPSVRARLVQLIELHAAKWDMKDELKTLYDDLLQDLKTTEK